MADRTSYTEAEAKELGIEIVKLSDEEWNAAYFKQKLPWTFDKWVQLYRPEITVTQENIGRLRDEWEEYLNSI